MKEHVPTSTKNTSVPSPPSAKAPLSLRKRLAYSILLLALPYLVVEALFSVLYIHGTILPPTSIWIYENTGRTIHFDPVRGYRLTSTPSRFARITKGTVEYVGTLRGNAQGFCDRDDFSPERSQPRYLRLAVFGDSYTAAQFLKQEWPDAVEDMANRPESSVKIQLLDFSVDGGGLANWWSVLTHVVKKERYELDGLLFAVYPGDLHRGFSIAEHRGYTRHMFARVASWNPEEWPKNPEEAQLLLKPRDGYIVTEDQFVKALNGQWHPDLQRPWKPYFLIRAMELMKTLGGRLIARFFSKASNPSGDSPGDNFSRGQEELIKQIAVFSQAGSLPVMVVHIPPMQWLIEKKPPPKDVLRFAELLHATFIDGSEAFSGLTERDIRSDYFHYDKHWGQGGSDRFARFFFGQLEKRREDWFPARGAGAVEFQDAFHE
jgi:hypothetical protein